MRVIYWLCLLSYALASVQVLLLLGGQPWHWGVLLALPLGWYVADAMSGLVHMLMDYHPCRPGVGLKEMFFYEGNRSSEDYLALRARTLKKLSFFETVSFDFKTHHPRPNALGRRTFEHQTLSLTVVLLPAFGVETPLLEALAHDPHLAPFLSLPAKDNGFDLEGLAVLGKRVFLGLRGGCLLPAKQCQRRPEEGSPKARLRRKDP